MSVGFSLLSDSLSAVVRLTFGECDLLSVKLENPFFLKVLAKTTEFALE